MEDHVTRRKSLSRGAPLLQSGVKRRERKHRFTGSAVESHNNNRGLLLVVAVARPLLPLQPLLLLPCCPRFI